ncbi:MAG: TetR family transcriptional regulator [Nitrospinaceae bacterium]|nr:MAG: TetR family transcriptional regulator [Nitrospinaceae bacterium]
MPARKIDEDDLMDRLTEVFRLHGYEGASLSRIAEATGLKRASLYHRFPGGKEEMAGAVLKRADDWFEFHILAPLTGSGDPSSRIREMSKRLSDFYGGGRRSCLLDSLSLGDGGGAIRQHIERSFTVWLGALVRVARAAGLSPAVAKERAEEALIGIQGALVMARANGDTKPFARVLQNLPQLLTFDSKKPKTKRSNKS